MFYSGKQFKLLLRMTLEQLDIRLQALASLTDFFSAVVTPIPITAPFGKSMLVLAPHQDDEAIGCGGALALQVLNGNVASAVILQDGADEHESVSMTREALVELRNQESSDAARLVGIDPPIFLGLKRSEIECRCHRVGLEANYRRAPGRCDFYSLCARRSSRSPHVQFHSRRGAFQIESHHSHTSV